MKHALEEEAKRRQKEVADKERELEEEVDKYTKSIS